MNKKDSTGFSLIELLIAIVVGAVFITAMTLIVNDYADLSTRNRNLVIANSYAEAKVEELRNNTYNSLNIGTTSLTSELPSLLPSPKSASMTVSQPQTGLKQVDLTITYNDLGKTRTYSYRTYEGELGVGQ
jgi:prepilin-type N-terminal cleavage/methylation domain-containing protein